MKQFITLAALLSFGAFAWAQIINPYECHCAVMVSFPTGEAEVYHMHPLQFDSCDNQTRCTLACSQEWDEMTNKGDLNSVQANGYTLGQEICLGAVEHFIYYIYDQQGFVNARMCEGNWEDTGKSTRQNICCDAGHYYECPA